MVHPTDPTTYPLHLYYSSTVYNTMTKLDVLLKQERLRGRIDQLQRDIYADRNELNKLAKRIAKKYGQD